MARTLRTPARRRALAVLTAGATVAGGCALLGPGTSSASSHREAPYILGDPAVDNTDTYAFVSPDDASSVTFVANWAPFSEPGGGPNFFPWDTDAAYDINVDNNGDAKADIVYRWTFADVDKRGAQERGKVDGTFLLNDGPVTDLDDPNLLYRQTYDLQAIPFTNGTAGTPVTIVNDGKVAPSNVGVASMPDYVELRQEAVTPLAGGAAGKSYVGQADDPFYLDLRIFDLLYGGDLSEVGYDTLSGYNVNTVALQVPKVAVAGAGNVTDNPVIGVWSTTSRKATRTFKATNAAPTTSATDATDATDDTGAFQQVSRLGNPLVNEAVVPANLKDYFNRSTPDKDAQFLGKVQDPEVPQLIELLYKIPNPNKTPKGADRPDLVAAFLTGIDGLNATKINKNNASPAPAEYLRLNMSIPPTTSNSGQGNRLGVVAGDNAGFPNGRRLGDDVVDIALQVLEGLLVPDQDPAVKKAVSGLGDAVSKNDVSYLGVFPYIGDPHTGSDLRQGASPVSFTQSFTSAGGKVTAQVTGISPAAPGGFAVLYRVNGNGSLTGLGQSSLNAAGTAGPARVIPWTSGQKLTLVWRVFPKRGSVGQINRGEPTTITVR
ncbi:MAG: DUF4331 domain-containing protein [Mycobacteriales bacterium]|nr:DUF4331 domain-containing protein [Mycobacteriales bacterium]